MKLRKSYLYVFGLSLCYITMYINAGYFILHASHRVNTHTLGNYIQVLLKRAWHMDVYTWIVLLLDVGVICFLCFLISRLYLLAQSEKER
ncbi:hypothetical protein A4S06_00160 [Erysipelotrichaceae bacterium MTC7]|nr:hypothetical protein A4S06_00160 [Erysipelotrichaceae bacterium MTC7]